MGLLSNVWDNITDASYKIMGLKSDEQDDKDAVNPSVESEAIQVAKPQEDKSLFGEAYDAIVAPFSNKKVKKEEKQLQDYLVTGIEGVDLYRAQEVIEQGLTPEEQAKKIQGIFNIPSVPVGVKNVLGNAKSLSDLEDLYLSFGNAPDAQVKKEEFNQNYKEFVTKYNQYRTDYGKDPKYIRTQDQMNNRQSNLISNFGSKVERIDEVVPKFSDEASKISSMVYQDVYLELESEFKKQLDEGKLQDFHKEKIQNKLNTLNDISKNIVNMSLDKIERYGNEVDGWEQMYGLIDKDKVLDTLFKEQRLLANQLRTDMMIAKTGAYETGILKRGLSALETYGGIMQEGLYNIKNSITELGTQEGKMQYIGSDMSTYKKMKGNFFNFTANAVPFAAGVVIDVVSGNAVGASAKSVNLLEKTKTVLGNMPKLAKGIDDVVTKSTSLLQASPKLNTLWNITKAGGKNMMNITATDAFIDGSIDYRSSPSLTDNLLVTNTLFNLAGNNVVDGLTKLYRSGKKVLDRKAFETMMKETDTTISLDGKEVPVNMFEMVGNESSFRRFFDFIADNNDTIATKINNTFDLATTTGKQKTLVTGLLDVMQKNADNPNVLGRLEELKASWDIAQKGGDTTITSFYNDFQKSFKGVVESQRDAINKYRGIADAGDKMGGVPLDDFISGTKASNNFWNAWSDFATKGYTTKTDAVVQRIEAKLSQGEQLADKDIGDLLQSYNTNYLKGNKKIDAKKYVEDMKNFFNDTIGFLPQTVSDGVVNIVDSLGKFGRLSDNTFIKGAKTIAGPGTVYGKSKGDLITLSYMQGLYKNPVDFGIVLFHELTHSKQALLEKVIPDTINKLRSSFNTEKEALIVAKKAGLLGGIEERVLKTVYADFDEYLAYRVSTSILKGTDHRIAPDMENLERLLSSKGGFDVSNEDILEGLQKIVDSKFGSVEIDDVVKNAKFFSSLVKELSPTQQIIKDRVQKIISDKGANSVVKMMKEGTNEEFLSFLREIDPTLSEKLGFFTDSMAKSFGDNALADHISRDIASNGVLLGATGKNALEVGVLREVLVDKITRIADNGNINMLKEELGKLSDIGTYDQYAKVLRKNYYDTSSVLMQELAARNRGVKGRVYTRLAELFNKYGDLYRYNVVTQSSLKSFIPDDFKKALQLEFRKKYPILGTKEFDEAGNGLAKLFARDVSEIISGIKISKKAQFSLSDVLRTIDTEDIGKKNRLMGIHVFKNVVDAAGLNIYTRDPLKALHEKLVRKYYGVKQTDIYKMNTIFNALGYELNTTYKNAEKVTESLEQLGNNIADDGVVDVLEKMSDKKFSIDGIMVNRVEKKSLNDVYQTMGISDVTDKGKLLLENIYNVFKPDFAKVIGDEIAQEFPDVVALNKSLYDVNKKSQSYFEQTVIPKLIAEYPGIRVAGNSIGVPKGLQKGYYVGADKFVIQTANAGEMVYDVGSNSFIKFQKAELYTQFRQESTEMKSTIANVEFDELTKGLDAFDVVRGYDLLKNKGALVGMVDEVRENILRIASKEKNESVKNAYMSFYRYSKSLSIASSHAQAANRFKILSQIDGAFVKNLSETVTTLRRAKNKTKAIEKLQKQIGSFYDSVNLARKKYIDDMKLARDEKRMGDYSILRQQLADEVFTIYQTSVNNGLPVRLDSKGLLKIDDSAIKAMTEGSADDILNRMEQLMYQIDGHMGKYIVNAGSYIASAIQKHNVINTIIKGKGSKPLKDMIQNTVGTKLAGFKNKSDIYKMFGDEQKIVEIIGDNITNWETARKAKGFMDGADRIIDAINKQFPGLEGQARVLEYVRGGNFARISVGGKEYLMPVETENIAKFFADVDPTDIGHAENAKGYATEMSMNDLLLDSDEFFSSVYGFQNNFIKRMQENRGWDKFADDLGTKGLRYTIESFLTRGEFLEKNNPRLYSIVRNYNQFVSSLSEGKGLQIFEQLFKESKTIIKKQGTLGTTFEAYKIFEIIDEAGIKIHDIPFEYHSTIAKIYEDSGDITEVGRFLGDILPKDNMLRDLQDAEKKIKKFMAVSNDGYNAHLLSFIEDNFPDEKAIKGITNKMINPFVDIFVDKLGLTRVIGDDKISSRAVVDQVSKTFRSLFHSSKRGHNYVVWYNNLTKSMEHVDEIIQGMGMDSFRQMLEATGLSAKRTGVIVDDLYGKNIFGASKLTRAWGFMRGVNYTFLLGHWSLKGWNNAAQNLVSNFTEAMAKYPNTGEFAKFKTLLDEMPEEWTKDLLDGGYIGEDVLRNNMSKWIESDGQYSIFDRVSSYLTDKLEEGYKAIRSKVGNKGVLAEIPAEVSIEQGKFSAFLTSPVGLADKLSDVVTIPMIYNKMLYERGISMDMISESLEQYKSLKKIAETDISVIPEMRRIQKDVKGLFDDVKKEATLEYQKFYKNASLTGLSRNEMSHHVFFNFFSSWGSKKFAEYFVNTFVDPYKTFRMVSRIAGYKQGVKAMTKEFVTSPYIHSYLKMGFQMGHAMYHLSKDESDSPIDAGRFLDVVMKFHPLTQSAVSFVYTRAGIEALKNYKAAREEGYNGIQSFGVSAGAFSRQLANAFLKDIIANPIPQTLFQTLKGYIESGDIESALRGVNMYMVDSLGKNMLYNAYDLDSGVAYERPDARGTLPMIETILGTNITDRKDFYDKATVKKMIDMNVSNPAQSLESLGFALLKWSRGTNEIGELDKFRKEIDNDATFQTLVENFNPAIAGFGPEDYEKFWYGSLKDRKRLNNFQFGVEPSGKFNNDVVLMFNELKAMGIPEDNIDVVTQYIQNGDMTSAEKELAIMKIAGMTNAQTVTMLAYLAQKQYSEMTSQYKKQLGINKLPDEVEVGIQEQLSQSFIPLIAKSDKAIHADLMGEYLKKKYGEDAKVITSKNMQKYIQLATFAEVADLSRVNRDKDMVVNAGTSLLKGVSDEKVGKQLVDWMNFLDSYDVVSEEGKAIAKASILYANRSRLGKIFNEVGNELPIEMLNLSGMIWDMDEGLSITPELLDGLFGGGGATKMKGSNKKQIESSLPNQMRAGVKQLANDLKESPLLKSMYQGRSEGGLRNRTRQGFAKIKIPSLPTVETNEFKINAVTPRAVTTEPIRTQGIDTVYKPTKPRRVTNIKTPKYKAPK